MKRVALTLVLLTGAFGASLFATLGPSPVVYAQKNCNLKGRSVAVPDGTLVCDCTTTTNTNCGCTVTCDGPAEFEIEMGVY